MYNYKIIDGEYVIFEVEKDGKIIEIMVDMDDFEDINHYSWHADWRNVMNNYYITRTEYLGIVNGKPGYKTIYLHNSILSPPKGKVVDHINHNPLDNRKRNLRLVCRSKNGKNRKGSNSNNTSGYRNVSWSKDYKQWLVQLQVNGTNKVLGKFDDVHIAGEFAEEMRQKHYGKFAGRG